MTLAAAPLSETKRPSTILPFDPANLPNTLRFGSNSNRLPPGVPLRPAFRAGEPSPFGVGGNAHLSNLESSLRRNPGRTALLAGIASAANSLGQLAAPQPAPVIAPQSAASGSVPLRSAAEAGWSVVPSPNVSDVTTLNDLAAAPSFELAFGPELTKFSESSRIRMTKETTRAVSSLPADFNRSIPGVRLPPGAHFSAREQVGNSRSGPTAASAGVAGMLPGPGAAARNANSQSDQWKIVPSANNTSDEQARNVIYGMACLSASDCWAVGAYSNGSAPQTLIQHWNGTAWSIETSPNTIATQNNILNSVACVSASDCWAVGYHWTGEIAQTLIEHWDGSAWSIIPSPNNSITADNILHDVTCVSTSDCWAVGYSFNGTAKQALVMQWDGTDWTIDTSAAGQVTDNLLYAVTCPSTSNCWAVGYQFSGAVNQTLIKHWDGTVWTIIVSPNSSPIENNYLDGGVTCTSGSDCWAVGSYYTGTNWRTLVQRWNGIAWTIVDSPTTSAAQDDFLYGVDCASTSECWATGYSWTGSFYQTLTQRWDGTAWTIEPSPNTSATQDNALYGVSCTASDCWVGGAWFAGSDYQTLIQRWDGNAWSIVPSPNGRMMLSNFLSGVTCADASDCWAVGSYSEGPISETLIERWDGNSWKVVPSPNTDATDHDLLYSVDCTSASNCWAVGNSLAGSTYTTLAVGWNGDSWSIVASPNVSPTRSSRLFDVTCTSMSDCWAVGYGSTSTGSQTLIEHWDGSSWVIFPSANVDFMPSNILEGVTCLSASECWAVGRTYDGTYRTLIQRWDGGSWTVVPSANMIGAQHSTLNAVTCTLPADCWAVGHFFVDGTWRALLERWDGSTWTIVTAANPDSQTTLIDVTCASASHCWAVGLTFNGTIDQTLIQEWDGTSWTDVTSPNTSTTQSNILNGVTCASPFDCWTVGFSDHGSAFQTLALRYTASAPPNPVSVVSRKTHGTIGSFDIDLPLTGNPGIECRQGQGTNFDEHRVVWTFSAPATVGSAACDGMPAVTSTSGNDVTVNCSGVPNAKVVNVTLNGVTVGPSSGNVTIPMAVLVGDTTANGAVNSSDISQTKAQSGQTVTGANFRQDVTVSGSINSADISFVKSRSGSALP